MRYLKYLFLALIVIVLVTLALANRGLVELFLFPAALVPLMGFQASVALPVFVVILLAVGVGVALGYVLEWAREWRIRRLAERRAREVTLLERENARLRRERHQGEDEVMALLDEAEARSADPRRPGKPATGTAVART